MDWAHWLEIVGRSAAVYVVVLAGLRFGRNKSRLPSRRFRRRYLPVS